MRLGRILWLAPLVVSGIAASACQSSGAAGYPVPTFTLLVEVDAPGGTAETTAGVAGVTPAIPTRTPIIPTEPPEATEIAATEATETPPAADASPTPRPPSPTPTPTPTATPRRVNGVSVEVIAPMTEAVRRQVREIYAYGQSLGRDSGRFSKLGDSLIATSSFLTGFDNDPYHLGEYEYLQPVIDQYAGSFKRYGVALRPGLHAWSVFDPLWADKDWCEPDETLLACEIRLYNPSVLLILVGTNDIGTIESFAFNMRKVVEFCLENGVIPVLATKADRFEGEDNRNNEALRGIAADYRIPLGDFDRVADTLPGRGLREDTVHLTYYDTLDYRDPVTLQRGYSTLNLTALIVLDAIWQTVSDIEIEEARE